jgi:hypothetical protein
MPEGVLFTVTIENPRSNTVNFLMPLSILRIHSVDDRSNEYGAAAGKRNGRGN